MAAPRVTPIYLLLPPNEVSCGGAEKRLIGMWLHICRRSLADVRLVINGAFLPNLRGVEEFFDIDAYRDRIVCLDARESPWRALARWVAIRAIAEPRALFHFAMTPPASYFVPASRVCFTIAAADLRNFSRRGRLAIYAGAARSAEIDCLDGDLAAELARMVPWKREHIHTTPGSFVDLDHFSPAPFAEKQPRLTFVGTFLDRKQCFRLLDVLPEVHAQLLGGGIVDPEYVFLGHDPERRGVAETGARYGREHGMRVYVDYAKSTSEFLRTSKVYFAVQYLENYPSKALLEAMACGALPIVTDVGKSRRIAQDDFAWFVPRDFSADDIARASLAILRLDQAAYDAKVAAARAFMGERFSAEAMTRYFLDLYARVAANP